MNQNNNKCGLGKAVGSVPYGGHFDGSGGADTSIQEVCHCLSSWCIWSLTWLDMPCGTGKDTVSACPPPRQTHTLGIFGHKQTSFVSV